MSSFISLLRHIFALTNITANDDDNTSTGIKTVLREYFAKKLATQDGANDVKLQMFLRIAEVLDPRYLHITTATEEDEAQTWINWPILDEVKTEIMTNARHIMDGREEPCTPAETTAAAQEEKITCGSSSLVGCYRSAFG